MTQNDYNNAVGFVLQHPKMDRKEAVRQLKEQGVNIDLRSPKARQLFDTEATKIKNWIKKNPGLTPSEVVAGLQNDLDIVVGTTAISKTVEPQSPASVSGVTTAQLAISFIKSAGGVDDAIMLLQFYKDANQALES